MTNIALVILKIFVSTNLIPGHVSGPPLNVKTNADGWLEGGNQAYAVSIHYPPKRVVVTNYVVGFWQGTNAVELITLQSAGGGTSYPHPLLTE